MTLGVLTQDHWPINCTKMMALAKPLCGEVINA